MPSKLNQKFQISNFYSQRGATAILISIFVLSILLLGVFTAASVMIVQIQGAEQISDSIPAFFAADAGAEKCYYQFKKDSTGCAAIGGSTATVTLDNGATFKADRTTGTQISSLGVFNNTNRKIELNW